eukprot:gene1015-1991_t
MFQENLDYLEQEYLQPEDFRQTAINCAIYGSFSAPKVQEIVAARGNVIELLRPDDTGKMVSVCSTPVFCVVRSLLPFRLAGSNKDYLVIGSDSGKITIVEYDLTVNDWKSVHCEAFGKTGCRRIVPGQYLAADPKGRAIMTASIEKTKFVYVMNRDSANRLTISSPLEAHKGETIVFSICGVDVGFDNPIFAMIEYEYTESDQDPSGEAFLETEKVLTYYELDLGLNHVVRKWTEPISRTAFLLLTVPGGDDGPSGVLICGENWVSYKHQGHPEVRTAIPRRKDMPDSKGLLITTAAMHKQKDLFFFLLQSELGDLYRVTLEIDPNDRKIVTDVVVTVFDTIPPANSLCITRAGLLFAAAEFGNHSLYQFQGIGDDPNAIRGTCVLEEMNEELGDDAESASRVALRFQPSTKLKNLLRTDDIDSLAPITDMLVEDLAREDTPQIHVLCGKGNRSTLRVLRHGVSVTEMAVSELPGRPTAVWTVRGKQGDPFDRYIIVSFSNATLVLSIGDTVEEVTDTGFLASAPTIDVVLLADNALIQVHSNGVRHIRPDLRTSEWKTPGKKQIEKASANSRQLAISLAGGEIIYFELDAAGQLMEMATTDLGEEVSCLDIGEVPAGRVRSPYLAVGCWNDTVRVLSLDTNDLLTLRSTMQLTQRAESVCLVEMEKERDIINTSATASTSTATTTVDSTPLLFLNVGLISGVLQRVAVDATAGSLSDSRQRFLGPKAVKLFRVMVRGRRAVLALSSRAWLMYNYQGRYVQAPISYDSLEYASNFSSEPCPEGVVAIAGNTLRIFTVNDLGATFNQTSIPLRYTPRKMCRVPDTNQLVIIETDHNEYNESERKQLIAAAANMAPPAEDMDMDVDGVSSGDGDAAKKMNGHKTAGDDEDDDDDEEDEATTVQVRGPLPPAEGKWASCIRVIEPSSGNTLELLELSENEAAFSVCTCRFSGRTEEAFIIVATTKDLTLHPRQSSSSSILVYRLLDNRLQLLHKTLMEDMVMSMCEFQGKLLVGAGRCLRLFELGKKKLLKKCENKLFPTAIVKLQTHGDRIYVGDVNESVIFAKYKRMENALVIFADDTVPRFVTSLCVLDYDTIGGADKFGNIWSVRLPVAVNDEIDNPTGSRILWDQGLLNGAPNKLEVLTHFHLGDMATSVVKCTLVPGGKECMLVATVTGAIYVFVPFAAKEDMTFFQHLEMYMRQELPSLCQRDHLSYRSYFQPVKETVDGDLCERYSALSYAKQKELADDVDRTPTEIMKKLEDTRNALL